MGLEVAPLGVAAGAHALGVTVSFQDRSSGVVESGRMLAGRLMRDFAVDRGEVNASPRHGQVGGV
jgi:hypothetical protein